MHAYSKKLTLDICSRRQLVSQSSFCNNCYSNTCNNGLDPFLWDHFHVKTLRDSLSFQKNHTLLPGMFTFIIIIHIENEIKKIYRSPPRLDKEHFDGILKLYTLDTFHPCLNGRLCTGSEVLSNMMRIAAAILPTN